jgi:RNA-directed DNA polymerase
MINELIVLSPTRWKLRKAIKTVNQHFEKLKLKQHPDKSLSVESKMDLIS